ncbi:hypothetical protein [Phenylobacterium sp.]|uniref:hypothetical protein n=1 Tax=Phenylobacterium sp. TaxID=1871053 RepID=UPI00356A1B01
MAPDILEPPHHPHGRSNLPRWLEWTTALSALVISICSIGIAVYNARIESRLLKANSYPYLVSGVSDATPDGSERISIELLNNGVGPADERSLKIKLGGRYVTDVKDFVRTAMGAAEAEKAGDLLVDLHDNEPTRFIAAKDRAMVFRIDMTPQNARYWELLDAGMNAKGVSLEYCYCSVFEECWAVQGEVRKPVKACVRDPRLEFRPKPKSRSVASPLPQG